MQKKEFSRDVLKKRTRRSFITGASAGIVGVVAWTWARTRSTDLAIAWPFRKILSLNEKIWHRYFRIDRAPGGPMAPAIGTKPRFNGSDGLKSNIDLSAWRLELDERSLSLDDIRAMPRTEATCRFKCIEGWSEVFSYAGVRFSDFVKELNLQTLPYVGLETPDAEYYVSLDIESMLHPNTLLAYDMNGAPLTPEHGAPLRLVVPVKYGIKSLKRIGTVFFSNERPPDFWNERGYDWYAGL
jgi:DMSO/TMAO reductase YedYZ molybdopterin-dependent catalytic subunit